MFYFRVSRHRITPLVSTFAALLLVSSARATYLDAAGDVEALVGGVGGTYHQNINPATQFDVVSGSKSVTDTIGNLTATSSSGSTAKFGQLTETSQTFSSGQGSYGYSSEGLPTATAFDIVTIHGIGSISVSLHTLLTGATSISPNDASSRVSQNVYFGPAGFVNDSEAIYLTEDHSNNSAFDNHQTGTVSVTDGQSFYVVSHLTQNGNVSPQQIGESATASTNATLDYWLSLSPGATLTSESGYLYGAPAAVPEPACFVALGFGILGLRRRRR